MGTQALQVVESINYLLDCHAGGRGFESRPLRHPLSIKQEVRMDTDVYIPKDIPNAKRLVFVAEAALALAVE